jgi:hypothetical protein
VRIEPAQHLDTVHDIVNRERDLRLLRQPGLELVPKWLRGDMDGALPGGQPPPGCPPSRPPSGMGMYNYIGNLVDVQMRVMRCQTV